MEAFDEMLCTNKIRRYTKDYYHRRMSAKLVNFISSKNKLKFSSDFDRKGAKKFLCEKAKAMEEIVLDDTTDEEKKNVSNDNNYKRNKSHNKFIFRNKHVKSHHSYNALLKNFQLNKLSSKKNSTIKDDNIYMSSNTVFLINSIKDIGKIMNKKNKRKLLGSIKKRYSNANGKESSYLMTGENDSFICTIVNEIKEFKN
jgi:hypothetical protein